jgi:hypothetical protein
VKAIPCRPFGKLVFIDDGVFLFLYKANDASLDVQGGCNTPEQLTLRSLGLERGQASYKNSITHKLSANSPMRANLVDTKQLALQFQLNALQVLCPPFVVLRSCFSYSYRGRNGHDAAVSKDPREVLIVCEFG